jgi:hypothetical protein
MPQYMLLLHSEDNALLKFGPEEMQKAIQKYLDWRSKPFVVDGRKLEPAGRVMRKNDGHIRVTDGPFSESREVLGGYYAIEAESFERAVELANDHPHLDFGTIEIRELAPPPTHT